jgi:hypothetical protein
LFLATSLSCCSPNLWPPFCWQALPIRWRVVIGWHSCDGCGGATLTSMSLASKHLGSGSLGRSPLPPSCLQLDWKVVSVPLDFTMVPHVSTTGASTLLALSLLTGYQIKCQSSLLLALPPLRLPPLNGLGWRHVTSGCASVGIALSSKGGHHFR